MISHLTYKILDLEWGSIQLRHPSIDINNIIVDKQYLLVSRNHTWKPDSLVLNMLEIKIEKIVVAGIQRQDKMDGGPAYISLKAINPSSYKTSYYLKDYLKFWYLSEL